jgi:hypothetical protein
MRFVASSREEPAVSVMSDGLTNLEWNTLIRHIRMGRCTPFIGAEAAAGPLPPRSQIADEWAQEYGYLLEDRNDLARVAQFMAAQYEDPWLPKDKIRERLKPLPPPDFTQEDEPHVVLASLPIEVYVTTNYGPAMLQAIESRRRVAPFKEPAWDFCRWHDDIPSRPSVLAGGFSPSEAQPLVYHLFGHVEVPESLVVTEDDYLDYLVNTASDPRLIPLRVQEAFAKGAFLFLGYRLEDLEFRVLLRSLLGYLKRNRTLPRVWVQQVQASQGTSADRVAALQEYLGRYCGRTPLEITVHAQPVRQFARDLKQRWEAP